MDRGDIRINDKRYKMRSSYKDKNYGAVLSSLVIGKRPENCVELGVLDGYSTIHIASALRFNQRAFGIDGRLYCWDLFDDYEYKHGNKEDVQKLLNVHQVTPIVTLTKGDAFKVAEQIQDNLIDFLHVDISNDGEILKKVMTIWNPKMKPFGIIAFEGGSEERDNVEWMIKYNKMPIRFVLKHNETIKSDFNVFVMKPFPSMTILQKKGLFSL